MPYLPVALEFIVDVSGDFLQGGRLFLLMRFDTGYNARAIPLAPEAPRFTSAVSRTAHGQPRLVLLREAAAAARY